MRASLSRRSFADFCFVRPSHTQNTNGRAALSHGTPGQINYGGDDVGEVETGQLGYFDPDDLRP